MKTEIIEDSGYTAIIEWKPAFGVGMPSRQYRLTIKKDDIVFIDRSGFTGSGAKTFFSRWVAKKLKEEK